MFLASASVQICSLNKKVKFGVKFPSQGSSLCEGSEKFRLSLVRVRKLFLTSCSLDPSRNVAAGGLGASRSPILREWEKNMEIYLA